IRFVHAALSLPWSPGHVRRGRAHERRLGDRRHTEGSQPAFFPPGPAFPPFGVADTGRSCLFFVAGPAPPGGLWKTDLTEAGTQLVSSDVSLSLIQEPAIGLPGRGLFSAFDAAHGAELWTSDGTAEGTYFLADLLPGPDGSSPAAFTRVGSRVFFTAMNESFARDLWVAELLPGLAVEDTSVYARPGGSEEAVFRVRLSPTTSDVVSVDFATDAATAVPGSDFLPASGSLRF